MIGLRTRAARIPANVRALSWVSFANDLASELAYPVTPLFLTVTLGAPVAVLGVIEGLAEGTAVALGAASGWTSDRAGGKRIPWIASGYGLSALARGLVAAAAGWGLVLVGRLADRVGKAARTAPRDALIRDSSAPGLVGASFGFHRALDTLGAVIGPLVAVALLAAGTSLRATLAISVVPGFAAVLLVRRAHEVARRTPAAPRPEGAPRFKPGFWLVIATAVVFSVGNSSNAFLLLRATDLGLSTTLAILAYALYNAVYAVLAWPLGSLSDRVPRALVIGGGLLLYAAVYLGLAVASAGWAVWPLFVLYGGFVAATDGVFKAWVADHVEDDRVGTAYGVYAGAVGAALFTASVLGGVLWTAFGPAATFAFGAAAALAALPLLALAVVRETRPPLGMNAAQSIPK